MTFNSYDVCAQIRLDWAEGRYDAGPSKKCPGGYSIPADKQCGGDKDAMKQRYKTQGAMIGGAIGSAPGAFIGSKIGGAVARGKLKKGQEAGELDKQLSAEEWKGARKGAYIGSVIAPSVGSLAGGGIGIYRAAKKKMAAKKSSGSSGNA